MNEASEGPLWGWWLVAVLVMALLAALAISAARHRRSPLILRLGPSFFFWLELIYLGVLFTLATLYARNDFGLQNVFEGGLVSNILPIGVPWFGAVGAVVISLQGIFDHSTQWNRAYNHWHIARPFFGAVLGVVAFFIFVLLLKAAGTSLEFLAADAGPDDFIIYYVVAFLVGYREETFRELVKRAVDLVLTPGQVAGRPAVTFKVGGAEVTTLNLDTSGGIEVKQSVEIQNSGAAPLTGPAVAVRTEDPADTVAFRLESDAVSGGDDLAPGTARSVEVAYSPAVASTAKGSLEVSSASLGGPAVLELTAAGD